MYQANVYKIMIGAPSDIKEEILVACRVINKWNNINSESRHCILMPLHWSFSSYPSSGSHPQKLLNKQLSEKSDVMLSFFGAKLGSVTDTDISGTVEEINEHLLKGKQVMVFFRNRIDASNVDIMQFKKLQDYKKTIQNKVIWVEYEDEHDLEALLLDKISLFANENLRGYESITTKTQQSSGIVISDWDKEHLKAWVNSGDIEAYCLKYSGWGRTYVLGRELYPVSTSEEVLEWDDFFERMEDLGYITIGSYNKDGEPIYKLKKAARDYVKNV